MRWPRIALEPCLKDRIKRIVEDIWQQRHRIPLILEAERTLPQPRDEAVNLDRAVLEDGRDPAR